MKTIIVGTRGNDKSLYGLGFQISYQMQGASFLPEALEALGHFTTGSYGGVHCKNFCYDPIPEVWRDFETQSQNMDVVSVEKYKNYDLSKPEHFQIF